MKSLSTGVIRRFPKLTFTRIRCSMFQSRRASARSTLRKLSRAPSPSRHTRRRNELDPSQTRVHLSVSRQLHCPRSSTVASRSAAAAAVAVIAIGSILTPTLLHQSSYSAAADQPQWSRGHSEWRHSVLFLCRRARDGAVRQSCNPIFLFALWCQLTVAVNVWFMKATNEQLIMFLSLNLAMFCFYDCCSSSDVTVDSDAKRRSFARNSLQH